MSRTWHYVGRLPLTAAGALAFALAFLLLLHRPALAQERVHVVAPGESLSTIAQRYGLTLGELSAYNGVTNPNLLFVGQQLSIPGSGRAPQSLAPATGALPGEDGYYTVVRGDTLSLVARNHGMTTDDLMRLNGIANANMVWVGQKLRVSARVAAVEQPAAAAPSRGLAPGAAEGIYVVQTGDTLSEIAAAHDTTVQQLLVDNGLPNGRFIFAGQRLRVRPAPAESALGLVAAPVGGAKWVEVNLSEQTLTAWQGDVAVMHTSISSGRSNTPTVTGRFTIGNKYKAQRMTGPGYDLPNVPWVMYFHGAYAIHGAYWHNNFGVPMSHGCVNMRSHESQMLYEWAPPGTEVYVHY
jgi:LysM repeat protein